MKNTFEYPRALFSLYKWFLCSQKPGDRKGCHAFKFYSEIIWGCVKHGTREMFLVLKKKAAFEIYRTLRTNPVRSMKLWKRVLLNAEQSLEIWLCVLKERWIRWAAVSWSKNVIVHFLEKLWNFSQCLRSWSVNGVKNGKKE